MCVVRANLRGLQRSMRHQLFHFQKGKEYGRKKKPPPETVKQVRKCSEIVQRRMRIAVIVKAGYKETISKQRLG